MHRALWITTREAQKHKGFQIGLNTLYKLLEKYSLYRKEKHQKHLICFFIYQLNSLKLWILILISKNIFFFVNYTLESDPKLDCTLAIESSDNMNKICLVGCHVIEKYKTYPYVVLKIQKNTSYVILFVNSIPSKLRHNNH